MPAQHRHAARFPTGSRPALGKLYCGYDMPGFTRVYRNGDLTIYRLAQSAIEDFTTNKEQ